MTTNTNDANVTALAMFISNLPDDVDSYELISYMKPFMPTAAFEALATSFDMCPIHLSDLDSCADDDNDELADAAPFEIPFTACRHLRRAI